MSRRQEWQDEAACRSEDLNWWFPANDSSPEARTAKNICRSCPVIDNCLEFAVLNGEFHGIWGGLDVRERNRLELRRAR